MAMFKDSQEIISTFTSGEENSKADFLKRENSNFIYGLPLLRHNIANYEEENYLMEKVFPKELTDMYAEGVVYIHDKKLAPYCNSLSCKEIAMKGIPTLAKNMLASTPTKRTSKLLRHFSNAVVLMSQQVSGAVMLSQMTTILASYLSYEGGNYETIKQDIESLIWELNMPLRAGSQSPFSNITMEFGKASDEIKDDFVVIGGEIQDYKYADIPAEYFNIVNKAIIEVMAKGNKGIPFTFPLITIQITDDFDTKNEMFLELLDKLYNWGGVYFENFRTGAFVDPYYTAKNPLMKAKDPEVSRSMCCRLNIDMSVLAQAGGGIFGSSVGNTGAVQVTNTNMNRILMEAKINNWTKAQLYARIYEVLRVQQEGQQTKREWILNNKELYPTFFAYNKDLRNYFNVFAVTGMHEGLINAGYHGGMKNPAGQTFAHEIMQYFSHVINEFIVKDKVACGIEFAPAENAGIKMARDDIRWAKEHGLQCYTQGSGKDVFLTAGCMLPFSEKDFALQIENSAEFQAYATSGSILHHFLEEKISPEILADYIYNLFEKPLNYITITPTLTTCMNCGQKFIGKDGITINECALCGSDDLATYTRVIGYVKAVSRKKLRMKEGKYTGDYNFWSSARRRDFAERKRVKFNDLFLVRRDVK